MKIAVDGMGGDRAPRVVVEGVVQAVQQYGAEVILVGDQTQIYQELKRFTPLPNGLTIHHASEVIGMDESPAASVRKKKDSSINVAAQLVKEGKADAFFSAGNTGAVVCATTLLWRQLQKVERAGIAVVFPNRQGVTILIDAGANIDPKPQHLLQYAIMGSTYSRYILHVENPRVGLLNVGEEESKGPEFIQETHQLLQQSSLTFIGNAEGRDVFSGKYDVIVCDGFVGNVALKAVESVALTLTDFLKEELARNWMTRMGSLMARSAFRALKKKMDYAEYGGAPLLGVNGICIIGHGSSSVKAIKNGIRVASEFVDHQVNQHIIEAIDGMKQVVE